MVESNNSAYTISMPTLTALALKILIKKSQNILEYGSGGSTLYAISNNKNVVTVETDKQYLQDLLDFCNSNLVTGLYINVGKTKSWGYAVKVAKNFSGIKKYALPPWDLKKDYDLVIIDGRFRVLSFMLSWNNAKPGTTIFWDDFNNRPEYHEILDYLPPGKSFGRASVWEKPENAPIFPDKVIENYNKDQR